MEDKRGDGVYPILASMELINSTKKLRERERERELKKRKKEVTNK